MHLLAVTISSALLLLVESADETYDSKYDNFNIDQLLSNDRILLNYTRCFLDKGPCTPEGKDFKKIIPEALEQGCEKCTPKQKELIRKVIKEVMKRQPDVWKQLMDKYDKDGKYKDVFQQFLDGGSD